MAAVVAGVVVMVVVAVVVVVVVAAGGEVAGIARAEGTKSMRSSLRCRSGSRRRRRGSRRRLSSSTCSKSRAVEKDDAPCRRSWHFPRLQMQLR